MTITFLEPTAWRGVFLGLCVFPTLVASSLFRLLGRRERADALADWIRRAWCGQGEASARRPPVWKRWAALAASLGVLVVTAYLLTGIVINLAYPLRPDIKPTDWGGPSLSGRWIAHGSGGVLFAIVTPVLCGKLRRWAERLL